MRRRGRQFLTRSFMWLTGIVTVSLIAGGVYFLLEPDLASKRLFAIPLLLVTGDLTFRFLKNGDTEKHVGSILKIATFPLRLFR